MASEVRDPRLDAGQELGLASPIVLASLLGGAVAWTVHLVVGVALVPDACDDARTWPLFLVSAVTVLATLGALAATRAVDRVARSTGPGGTAAQRRARFVATVSLFLNLLFLALIVLETVPVLFVDPCQ